MDTLLRILTHPWVAILGFVAAPLFLAICATLYCQKRWGRVFSWVVGLAYLCGGSFLFWGMETISPIYKELRKESNMLVITKWLFAVPPISWVILFLLLGAAVVWKDQVWRWRHANLVCILVLLLLVAGIFAAALHPMFFGRMSTVS